ncbi:hypothetical protein DERP_003335 [Dermatophagoides pteronyssinus]|uniref:Uncharacterized protein n=1 Tax=Dermatophagoides pteronyssinus TaxID=6956 RepID=A0ABQ8JJQ0_DERPT|nr:hypothetical protein DERP_003335 [Dermatophagoides pteronyssinus]
MKNLVKIKLSKKKKKKFKGFSIQDLQDKYEPDKHSSDDDLHRSLYMICNVYIFKLRKYMLSFVSIMKQLNSGKWGIFLSCHNSSTESIEYNE